MQRSLYQPDNCRVLLSSNTTPNPESNTKPSENRFATLMQIEEKMKTRDMKGRSQNMYSQMSICPRTQAEPRMTRSNKITADPSMTGVAGKIKTDKIWK
jgi:hypothetical protein